MPLCIYRTSLMFIAMVFLLHNYVYTLSIQDTKAWYCGPAEPFVSLLCHILWGKKWGWSGLTADIVAQIYYYSIAFFGFFSFSSLLYLMSFFSTDFVTISYFWILNFFIDFCPFWLNFRWRSSEHVFFLSAIKYNILLKLFLSWFIPIIASNTCQHLRVHFSQTIITDYL